MTLTLTIPPAEADKILPPEKDLADAASRGMTVTIKRHLREKNNSTAPNRHGLPKSNYYSQVAETVRGTSAANRATVEIGPDNENGPGNGIALHFYGGTVLPKKKALAVPINAAVADIWPSEVGEGGTTMFWPKNSSHGFIKDKATGELLWLLIPKATIPADPTVLPSDDALVAAAERAVLPLLEAS